LSVLCAALSMIRTEIPNRASSDAAVIPTGPAPLIKTAAPIGHLKNSQSHRYHNISTACNKAWHPAEPSPSPDITTTSHPEKMPDRFRATASHWPNVPSLVGTTQLN
jgi:hypothetical protein